MGCAYPNDIQEIHVENVLLQQDNNGNVKLNESLISKCALKQGPHKSYKNELIMFIWSDCQQVISKYFVFSLDNIK